MPLAFGGTSSNVTDVFKGADACRAPEPGTRQRGNTRNNERTAILFFTTTACRCFEGCATSRSEAGQNRLLQAGGGDDCGLWIAECGLEDSGLLINPQSEFRIPQSRGPLAAGGSDL